MSKYQELYNQKKVSVDEAISRVKSGDIIHTSLCAMEPMTLLANLHKAAEAGKKDITITTALEMRTYPFNSDPQYSNAIHPVSMFLLPPARKQYLAGIIDYSPTDLHNISLKRFQHKCPNIALIAATPMDSHGYVRCSLSQLLEGELLDVCERIIIEVNPNYPVVGGDTAIHISQIDCLIETNTPVPQLPAAQITDIDKTIGAYVAELINDGDTIQLGIGGMPDAAAMALVNKKNLGVHTEMISSSIAELVEKGVINGSKKSLRKGKIVATFVLGDQKLYDTLNNNPGAEILRASYVNDPFVIAQNDNMVSVNSCIGIDLMGQVCSESIATSQYSGTGGASDFAFGASRSKNGRCIIAVHSTTKNDEISAITSALPPASIVSIRRNFVDYVVTEYGIAKLTGRDVKERVENLIAIAHPNFREQLKAEAKKLNLH